MLFEGVKAVNSNLGGQLALTEADCEVLKETFNAFFTQVLGLQLETNAGAAGNEVSDGLMELILALRADAKTNKDWSTADRIRDHLKAMKIEVKDTKDGTTWTYDA